MSSQTPEPILIERGGLSLSGLVARPAGEARALIVALHGGGYGAAYWNSPVPRQSLLALAPQLGFTVLALDRPGYGASRGADPARLTLERQTQDLFDAIEAWTTQETFKGPVFLIGHSIGGILALMMAADPRSPALSGIDVLGVPFHFPEDGGGPLVRNLAAKPGDPATMPKEDLQRYLLFGPEGSYPPEAFDHHARCVSATPAAEYQDGLAAPAIWSRVMPAIRLPVQFTLTEFETMQCTGWSILEEVRALLTNSPRARVDLQRGSGHNASLHHIARAYHLRALAFFEECQALDARK